MSVNPRLREPGGPPELMHGESVVLKQDGVAFEMESGGGFPGRGGNWYGKGDVYLTEHRIVFVKRPVTSESFVSFSLPLSLIESCKLHQPIFGANYFAGSVLPVTSDRAGGMAGRGEFKLRFNRGGVTDFLFAFNRLYREARAAQPRRSESSDRAADAADARAAAAAAAAADAAGPPPLGTQTAFVDPQDPSKVYVTVAPGPPGEVEPPPPYSQAVQQPSTGARDGIRRRTPAQRGDQPSAPPP